MRIDDDGGAWGMQSRIGTGEKKIVTGKPTHGRRRKAITVPVWDVIPKERERCRRKGKKGHLLYSSTQTYR